MVNPLPAGFLPGFAVTSWHGDGLRASIPQTIALLQRYGLSAATKGRLIVQLHAPPNDLSANLPWAAGEVRRALPGARLWTGVAWDGYVANFENANSDAARARVDEVYLKSARAAHSEGIELFVGDNEAAGKTHPAAARDLSCEVIDGIRAACPGMLLGHTSYDFPTYHPEERNNHERIDPDAEGYPWSAWLGGDDAKRAGVRIPVTGRVDLELPQRYAAPAKRDDGTTPIAGIGALQRRVDGSTASFNRAIALGWIDASLPIRHYVQLHHVTAIDTVGVSAQIDLMAGWASPSRIDVEGTLAVAVMLAAQASSLSLAGPLPGWNKAVTAWAQGKIGGLVIDGQFGPASRRATFAWQQAHGVPVTGVLDDATLAALTV